MNTQDNLINVSEQKFPEPVTKITPEQARYFSDLATIETPHAMSIINSFKSQDGFYNFIGYGNCALLRIIPENFKKWANEQNKGIIVTPGEVLDQEDTTDLKKKRKIAREISKKKSEILNKKDLGVYYFCNQEISKKKSYLNELQFKNFEGRICLDQPQKKWVGEFSDGVETKIIEKPLYCNSPYCSGEECFKDRVFLSKDFFRMYFYAFSPWRTLRGSKWLHFSFGFRPCLLPSREQLAKGREIIRLYFKKLERVFIKEFGKDKSRAILKAVGISDLAHKQEDGTFRIHHHFAIRPFYQISDTEKCRFVLKTMHDIGEPMGIIPSWHGSNENSKNGEVPGQPLRKAEDLIDYFSKRHAGSFGHDSKGTGWKYSDIMSARDYYNSFYRGVKVITIGFNNEEKSDIRKRWFSWLRNRLKREALELIHKTRESLGRSFSQFKLISWRIEDYNQKLIKIQSKDPPDDLRISIKTIKPGDFTK